MIKGAVVVVVDGYHLSLVDLTDGVGFGEIVQVGLRVTHRGGDGTRSEARKETVGRRLDNTIHFT